MMTSRVDIDIQGHLFTQEFLGHSPGSLHKRHFWDLILGLEKSESLGRSGIVPVVVLKALLGPLKVHAGLARECLQHFLLLWGEGGHWAGGRCGSWHGKGSLALFRAGIPYKQLVIYNAKP